MIYLVELILGICFGLVLQKCGLGKYHRVVNQFRLRDWTVMQFMLTAVTVGSALTVAAWQLGWVTPQLTMPEGALVAALVGGAVLGVGMALSGMCPGTIVAGIGCGSLDYLVPGVLGLVAGALVMGPLYEPVMLTLYGVANLGTATLADLLGTSPWVPVGAFALCDVALYLATSPRLAAYRRRNSARHETGEKDAPAPGDHHEGR